MGIKLVGRFLGPSLLAALMIAGAAAAETPAPAGDSHPVEVALIAGGISVLGVLLSSVSAYVMAKLGAKQAVEAERTRRQGDLALKISEMVSADGAASRRFSIAVVKIMRGAPSNEGMVFFVPINSRITAGRDLENDIHLGADGAVSRFHCGFVSEEDEVCLEDYASTNGTRVNGEQITVRTLNDGDHVAVGSYEFLFKKIHRNRMLLP